MLRQLIPAIAVAVPIVLSSFACSNGTSVAGESDSAGETLRPALETEPVGHDPDDPAIWIAPDEPAKSLILATDKVKAQGGLYVFGLDGRIRQVIGPLDRPNNVDVEYGLSVNGSVVDVAVLTERLRRRLRIFAIPRDGGLLRDLAPEGLPVLEGQPGEEGAPMGVALYKRPRDGAVFAIISPKAGGAAGYLWQYRLEAHADRIAARFVRRFGTFSGLGPEPGEPGEIEAVAVDDRFGVVYYADERFGIRTWHADPEAAGAETELAVFGQSGYIGDREGLAFYERADGVGFLVSSDQVPGRTRLHVYRRDAGDPQALPLVAVVPTDADSTDGLDATSRALPGFPSGFVVMMNSSRRTFQIYPWERIAAHLGPRR